MNQHYIDLSLPAGPPLSEHYTVDGRPRTGSPEDRGASDRYYGRDYQPHWYRKTPQGPHAVARVEAQDMTSSELALYDYGYGRALGEKEWRGEPCPVEETIEW